MNNSATPIGRARKRKKGSIGLVYISPWIIGFLVFQLYPLMASLVYSFTDFGLLSSPKFVGLKNYIYIFTKDKDFFQSLKVTVLYVLISVPAKLIFALFIAMILNIRLKHTNIFRTIYYLPSIFGGSVAISILWRSLFMHDGLLNSALARFNVPPTDWLGNPDTALYTICLLSVWQFGSSMVIFYAGLKGIPSELYEACKVDGGSRIKMFFTITMPMLTPLILFNIIMQTINAFQEFTAAFVITSGGPMKSTYLYGMMLYQNGFKFLKMGYASALSWILFIILMVLTFTIFKFFSLRTFYGGETK